MNCDDLIEGNTVISNDVEKRLSRRKFNDTNLTVGNRIRSKTETARSTDTINRRRLLTSQAAYEIDSLIDLNGTQMSKRNSIKSYDSSKFNSLTKNAVILVSPEDRAMPQSNKKAHKSINSLFGGMRSWFRSASSSKDDLSKEEKKSVSSFFLSASICTSSGRKKSRSNLNLKKDKSSERERSESSSRKLRDDSYENSSDKKNRSKKKVEK